MFSCNLKYFNKKKALLTGLFLFLVSEQVLGSYQDIKSLSQSQTWHGLLDFKDDDLEIKDQSNYLSNIDNFSPYEELIKTVDEYKKFLAGNSSFFCIFPSRAYFINKYFKNLGDLDLKKCKEFQKWSNDGKIDSISLLYVTGYLKNPASFFGHTLIKFNSSTNDKNNSYLLENTLNYGAETGNDAALPYVIKGLIGGYNAGLQSEKFFRLSAQYQEFQMRDIYEYRLSLTQHQQNLIVSYTFEMNRNRYDYYFLSDNCAYRMNRILGVGLNKEPMPKTPWKAPIDLLIGVNDLQIVKDIYYHPSQTTRTLSSIEALNENEKNLYKVILKNPNEISKYKDQVSNNIKIALIETLNYKKLKQFKENNVEQLKQIDENRKNILLSIDKNKEFTRKKIINTDVPHKINRPTLISYAFTNNKRFNNGHSVKLRGANFEFLDIDNTRLGNSEFVFLSPTLMLYENKILLEEFTLFKVLSLNDLKTNIPDEINFSWGIDVSRKNISDLCYPCNSNQLKGSLGKGLYVNDNMSIYNLININAHQSRENSGNISGSLELGIIYKYKKIKFHIKHENINFDKTDIFDTEENSINIKFNINYGYDFSIKYNKNEFNEAYSINLNKYF